MIRLKICLGIFIISALIITGIYIPKIYSIVYDKNSLNQVEYMQMDMDTYEYKSFNSFEDKLSVIASHIAGGVNLSPVQLSVSDSFSNEEVIDNMRLQLQYLYESKLLPTQPEISYDHLQSMELYTIYPNSADMDSLSGITYWKINLNRGDSYDMTVYMDTEFGKIYFLKLSDESIESYYEESSSSYNTVNPSGWEVEFIKYYELSEKNNEYFKRNFSTLALLYIDGYTLECIKNIGKVNDGKAYLFLGLTAFFNE